MRLAALGEPQTLQQVRALAERCGAELEDESPLPLAGGPQGAEGAGAGMDGSGAGVEGSGASGKALAADAGGEGGLVLLLRANDDRRETLRRGLAGLPQLHAAVLAPPGHCRLDRPGLLVADMDSTLAQGESIDEMARLWGCGEQVAQITERAMRGDVEFADSLRERVRLFAGMPLPVLHRARDAARPSRGAQELLAGLAARGWKTAVVSGGFADMVAPFARRLGADAWFCNRLELRRKEPGKEEEQTLTGELEGQVLDAEGKRRALLQLAGEWGLAPAQTLALGDGANDLAMLAQAGVGAAFAAKPKVRESADAWLNRGDLADLLAILPGA